MNSRPSLLKSYNSQSFASRLRSVFNVRRRLLLLFLLLLAGLGGMAQMFYQHVQDSRAAEREFAQAQAQLRLYTEAHEEVLQFRIVLLRAGLLATIAPEQVTAVTMERVAAAQAKMEQRLQDLAVVDAAESAAMQLPVRDVPALIARMRELAAQRRYPELLEYIQKSGAGFNQRHRRVLDSMQRTEARSQATTQRAAELHQMRLDASTWAIGVTLLAALILSYLTLRNILYSLHSMSHTLRAIPAILPPRQSSGGDEFDEMRQALRQLRISTVELNRLAYVNPLTSLPNSVKLSIELEKLLGEARQLKVAVALLFVDLNDFRDVNDAIGHDTGDACLRELGQRLLALIAPREGVFHFSGDLFAIILEAPSDQIEKLAETLAARVHSAILLPVEAAGRSLRLTASIGVALFPEHASDARGLISAADAAVHLAKRVSRDNTQFGSRDLAERADANLKLTEDIQRGLAAAEFLPYYQPIIDVEADRVVSAEALLRWRHPQRGLLYPADFLEVAEHTGQLNPITARAFAQACTDFARWPKSPRLTFNLSPRQIRASLPATVRSLLQETGLPPERLEFEITENALMDRVEQVAQVLHELRDMGIQLSLDDFGTGYASLNYLRRLPVNKLKIDRSFVNQLDGSRASLAIVNAMLSIARNLHLEVVAEGVETLGQMEILRAMGCRLMQGYLFKDAVPLHELKLWTPMPPSLHLAPPSAPVL